MNCFILVTGSRDISANQERLIFDRLNAQVETFKEACLSPFIVLFEGGYRGVDNAARQWAFAKGIQPMDACANWGLLKKRAGPIRNDAMVRVAHGLWQGGWHGQCLAFPSADSQGTIDCMERIQSFGLPLEVTRLS